MRELTKIELGVEIFNRLNTLKNGSYELRYHNNTKRYVVEIRNKSNVAVYGSIIRDNHDNIDTILDRITEAINNVNKYG